MRNVIFYIAVSLDGYIADVEGGVDWLAGDGIPLFQKNEEEIKLKLIATERYNGITDLVYARRG